MGRKRIGLDLDDVLLDFMNGLLPYHNQNHGTSVSRDDTTTFSLEQVFCCTVEEMVCRIDSFYETPQHEHSAPVPGAVEALRKLHAAGHELHVVTAKPERMREQTRAWLDAHFPGMIAGIHFCNHFVGGQPRKKGEVCRELGIALFVDDALHNMEDIAASGVPVLLFDAPWNRGADLPPLATRVYSWEEAAGLLGT